MIIGIIVAGIVSGRTIVNQTKIRSQIADLSKLEVAYNTFRSEYNAIPGDFSNATSYWSGTRNGNGNRNLYIVDGGGITGPRENMLFFEHLSKVGLVPEPYVEGWVHGLGYRVSSIENR